MKQHKSQMQLLDDAIRFLEVKQKQDYNNLKTQFDETAKSLKPINIFNQVIKDFRETPGVKMNLFETVLSISGGYFSRKLIVGKSNTLVKTVLGYVLQYTVTNFISKKVHVDDE
ncbi:hypothetical protein [Mariniflexile sp.]|uniref:hypothetical protein n=1 Tax=Mariniflexile sp. TaxID=1979402 RepID=UPI0035690CFB